MKNIFAHLFIILVATTAAHAENYHLDISRQAVNITGKSVKKFTLNGGIPGPTLYFTEGEDVVITVTNHLDEDTSVHWHGILLPGEMDGVPGMNGFPGIKPGETFTYRFQLRQSGTYWYHAHSMGQEQDGLYGSLVIKPKEKDPNPSDRDYVVLISDFSNESWRGILGNLKRGSAYYNYAQRTVGDLADDVKKMGASAATKNALDWGDMRMSPTDLSDVSGYTFLMNGKTPEQNWTGVFKPGERIRLRFINASAMSFYDVHIPGLKMKVVQADGQNVEAVDVDEFRFGVAETYDVIVEPKENKPYSIVVEPIDRTGFALGTLTTIEGTRGEIPTQRKRTLLTMADMGMGHDMGDMHHMHHNMDDAAMEQMKSGWADADTPEGHKALNYADLKYLGTQTKSQKPDREMEIKLGGNMERYIWTLDGKKFEESGPMMFRYGKRVKITFTNDTMMAHPMHLHGMFVQLDNGQPANKIPNKHTIIIPPGQSYSVFLTADEPGEWAFHCHLLYHMMSGMMTKAVVTKIDSLSEALHEHDHASHEHAPTTFYSFTFEDSTGHGKHNAVTNWDLDGWIGSDYNKLWLKSEGEVENSEFEQSEIWAMYSANVSTFWDAQVGLRQDIDPDSRTHLVLGTTGLAKYFFETEAHLFLSNELDATARLRQENEFLLTQRIILEPYFELNLSAQDIPDYDIGAGITNAELGLELRYEFTRKLAPFIDLRYEREYGETAKLTREHGEHSEDIIGSLGVRVLF